MNLYAIVVFACSIGIVYINEGCRWRNLNGREVYEGGQTLTCSAPLDAIPVFFREGTLTEISLRV